MRLQVIAKEGDDDREDDEVGQQQHQHEQVPVEPETTTITMRCERKINFTLNKQKNKPRFETWRVCL